MPRCNARRQREREHLPPVLAALIASIPSTNSAYTYLCTHYVSSDSKKSDCSDADVARYVATRQKDATCAAEAVVEKADDVVIEGAGLDQLVAALGPQVCPDGVADILRITRRSRRSRSTFERIYVHELCFALSQATMPIQPHLRRRVEGESTLTTAELEGTPLMQYYRGKRFAAMLQSTQYDEDSLDTCLPSTSVTRSADATSRCGTTDPAREEGCGDHTAAHALPETEWVQFVQTMSVPLPMSLRVHHREPALQRMARRELQALCHPSLSLTSSTPLWLSRPGGASAAALTQVGAMPAADMYTCRHAAYHENESLQCLCRTLHAAGAVSFQEVVSAIPALVLQVQPHHRVWDMCAAPGSKTLHVLDAMLEGSDAEGVCKRRLRPALGRCGVVVANEKDRVKATQTLPARLKRYHAPHVLCTRCDATQWPRLYETRSAPQRPCPSDSNDAATAVTMPMHTPDDGVHDMAECLFDRVLCDVPCSGDGTLRKDVSVASTWGASYVDSLVRTQKALLRRGLDSLRVGGLLVYSTCSLNPAEDEEVVCSALEMYGDCVELVNVNAVLRERGADWHSRGGLRRRDVSLGGRASHYTAGQGSKDASAVSCGGDLVVCGGGGGAEKVSAMPTSPAGGVHAGAEPPMNYDGAKVLRVLPHRDNTGGFFVAAFCKRRLPDWTPPTAVARKLNQWMQSRLWAPVRASDPAWRSMIDFYGLSEQEAVTFAYWEGGVASARRMGGGTPAAAFAHDSEDSAITPTRHEPRMTTTAGATRTEAEEEEEERSSCEEEGDGALVPVYHLNPHSGQPQRIVLTTRAAARMLFATLLYKGPGVELVSVGMRAFELYDARYLTQAACRWRVVAESASFLAPHCRARRVRLSTQAHRALLEQLFRQGYVSLREHGCTILRAALSSCCVSTAAPVQSVAEGARDKSGVSTRQTGGGGGASGDVVPRCDERCSLLCRDSALIPILDALQPQRTGDGAPVHDDPCAPAAHVEERLVSDIRVGGVLLELTQEADESEESERVGGGCSGESAMSTTPWVVSATLSASKLELTIDASLREFGLSVYLKRS